MEQIIIALLAGLCMYYHQSYKTVSAYNKRLLSEIDAKNKLINKMFQETNNTQRNTDC